MTFYWKKKKYLTNIFNASFSLEDYYVYTTVLSSPLYFSLLDGHSRHDLQYCQCSLLKERTLFSPSVDITQLAWPELQEWEQQCGPGQPCSCLGLSGSSPTQHSRLFQQQEMYNKLKNLCCSF